jgi:hypothetical protein
MSRILRWKCQTNGIPWYYNIEKETRSNTFSKKNDSEEIVSKVSLHNVVEMKSNLNEQIKDSIKNNEPEWKNDEEEILKGDRYSSYSYGGGRFGNQIIRNLCMSLIAERFNLIMRYQRGNEIEKLGFTLFNGIKKYRKHKVVTEKNFHHFLKRQTMSYNIRSNPTCFYQTKEITDHINNYLNSSDVMEQIINNNNHKERYKNNNDCFVHVRLGDVMGWSPGFDYYYKMIMQFKYDNLYIATDSPGHEIIAMLRKKLPNLQIYDTNLPDIMLFGSTCKYVVLSYGSFSAVIGYLSFFSHVFFKKISEKTAWDWCSNDKNNMFYDKYNQIGRWNEIE